MAEVDDLVLFLRYLKEKIYDVRNTQFKHDCNEATDRITLHYATLKTDIKILDNLYQAPLKIISRVNEWSLKGITFIGRDQGVKLNRTVTLDFKEIIAFLERYPQTEIGTSKKRNF